MSLIAMLYFAGISANVKAIFSAVAIIFFISIVIYLFYYSVSFDVELNKKFCYILVVVSFIFGLISALIPSEKTIYYMAGAYVAQEAIKSDIGQDIMNVISIKVKNYAKSELLKEEAVK